MRTIILFTFISICAFAGNAQQKILVDPGWLQNRMTKEDLVIFHISREAGFEQEHLPGAVYISPRQYTFDDENQNIVFDRPSDQELRTLFEANGVSNTTEVVIYTTENWVPLVTRLYFTLDYLGHGAKTYILDGGMAAWKAAGYATTDEVTTPLKGDFTITPKASVLADQQYMLESVKNEGNTILDCRSEVYYKGIQPTHGSRPGRIPTAKSIPYTSLYGASDIGAYEFKSQEALEELFAAQGLSPEKPLVLYCHIGMQLTVVYTAARMLGYSDIRMYDGSMHEWGPNEELPIELN